MYQLEGRINNLILGVKVLRVKVLHKIVSSVKFEKSASTKSCCFWIILSLSPNFLLQMLCYLIVQLADAFEVEATKPSTEVIVSGKVFV